LSWLSGKNTYKYNKYLGILRHPCLANIAPFPPVPSGVLQIAVSSTKMAFLVLGMPQIAVSSTKTGLLVLGTGASRRSKG
jgi:hypothetical protein